MYIELHTASAFSFLQGASLPELLVDRAAELGYPAVALLDRDGVYGLPRFHKAATAAGLRAIVGAELTIGPSGPGGPGRSGRSESSRASNIDTPAHSAHQAHQAFLTLPVLCESADGYRNLCRLITRMKMRSPKGEGALQLDELEGCTTGLVALAGRAALDGRRFGVGGLLDRLVGLFGRGSVYVELQRHLRRDARGQIRHIEGLDRADPGFAREQPAPDPLEPDAERRHKTHASNNNAPHTNQPIPMPGIPR